MAFSSALCHDLPPANATIQRFDARFWHLDFPLSAIATIVSESPDSLTVHAEFRSNRDLVGLLWTSADKHGHPVLQYLEDRDYRGVKFGFVANPRNPYDFNVSILSNGGDLIYRMFPFQVSGANLVPIPSSQPLIDGNAPAISFAITDVFPGGAPAVPAGFQIYVLDFDNLKQGFNFDGDLINPQTIQQMFFAFTPAEFGLGANARIGSEGTIIGATTGSSLEGYNFVTPVPIDYVRVISPLPNLRLKVGDVIRFVLGVPTPDGGGGKAAAYRIVNQTEDMRVTEWYSEVVSGISDGAGGTFTAPIYYIKLPQHIDAGAWLGGGRAQSVNLQLDTPIGSVPMTFTMQSISVTGARATLPRRFYPQPVHGMHMTNGFDDAYNVTPWRQVDNTYNLGYRGFYTMYMGMSHYFKAASYGSAPGVLDSQAFNNKVIKDALPLNVPTQAYCASLFANMRAKELGPFVWSTSFEILNSYMPEEWKQRDYQQRPALSGWVPPSSFIQPTNNETLTYLANVIKHGLSLMRAAGWTEAECCFQVGEPWWWDGSYTQGAPCIYDPTTTALYVTETGTPVPTPLIQSFKEPVTPAQLPYLEWLGTKLGNATNTIRDIVKGTYPASQATLLFFTPQIFSGGVLNTPGLPLAHTVGGSMLPIINFPISYWTYPQWDFVQIEDYDWIINGEFDKLPQTRDAALNILGYPLAVTHYFVGFVLTQQTPWVWPNINIATKQAKLADIPYIYVWAYPQVIRDGILYDDTILSGVQAIQPPLTKRRQLPDEVTAAVVRPIFFCQLNEDSFMNSSDRNIDFNGHTWYATGALGSVGNLMEGMSDPSSGFDLTLIRVPLTMVDYVSDNLRNGDVKLFVGLLDEAYQLIVPPRLVAGGHVLSNDVDLGQNFASFNVLVRSPLSAFARSDNSKYTDEGQQLKVPGDRGFKFISGLEQLKITWGDQNA